MPPFYWFAAAFVILITGCTTSKEYSPPPKLTLQDPLPSKALVYLLRAPYDETDISLSLNGRHLTALPRSRYTAISIDPGKYELATELPYPNDKSASKIPTYFFSIKENERLILYLPAPERENIQTMDLIPGVGNTVFPIIVRRMRETGSIRQWVQGTEDDASWFIHYAKLHLE